jgi:Asp-tRNA(Asn)/Glu-tRNA(Gln) amidotransferase A subunit family amidase
MAEEDIAFAPVTELAAKLRSREISPVELTRLYLDRLVRLDPKLFAVITLTEEVALREADEAEREILAGRYRGPLHGLPYGLKDLIDTAGIRTTWGIKHHENRVPAEDATVVDKLRQAGAVLVAKLAMGELARGAQWFGGTTRCPWDTTRSASGSSSGPAAATAAGLVGFAIGSETFGSIVSPASVCGITGLRPTYGRVSRFGAMPLSWTFDRLGPMCRSVEDCALVLDAIRGVDARDPSAVAAPFPWEPGEPLSHLRVGIVEDDFKAVETEGVQAVMSEALKVIEGLGVQLQPVELPDYPYAAVYEAIRGSEAAVSFEDLIVGGHLGTLVNEGPRAWKNIFPVARLTPAVTYLKAQQIRALMQKDALGLMEKLDVWVAPAEGPATPVDAGAAASRPAPPPGNARRTSPFTNCTGQPAVCLPAGFVDGLPVGIQFVGRSFGETAPLRLALAYQQATDWHRRRPPL